MAFSNRLKSETFIATGDLSGLQYHIMNNVAAHYVSAAAANKATGVLQNKPQAGEHATVAVEGITKVKAGGAVAVGNYITSAASGWATAIASGQQDAEAIVIGRALTAAASGSVFSLEIDRMLIVRSGGLA